MTESGQVFDRLAMPGGDASIADFEHGMLQKAQHDRRDDGRVAGAPLAALGSGRHFAGVWAKMSAASLGMISISRSRGSQKSI